MNRYLQNMIVIAGLGALVMAAWALDNDNPAAVAQQYVNQYKAAEETAKMPPAAPLASPPKPPDRNDLIRAVDLYQTVGAENTTDEALRRAYIEALTLAGYQDLAAEQWERITEVHPENAAAWREAGRSWYESGPAGDEHAFKALERSRVLDPDSVDAAETWRLLGRLHHRAGLYARAEEAYREAFKRKADHVRAIIGLAAIDAREGRIMEASKPLDALGAAAQPYDVETRLMLRKALVDFESGRGIFPDDAEHHGAYARLLYRAGRLPDALVAANRSIKLRGDDVETLNFLGAMLLQAGQTAQAQAVYQQSLTVKPDQPNVTAMLQQMSAPK